MNAISFNTPSMVGGEVSPLILGRTDIERFTTSALTLENFQPLVEGPLTRRMGTEFRAELPDPARLVAFNTGSFSGVLVMSNLKITTVSQDTLAPETVTIVTPYTLAQVADVQVCQVNDVVFMTHRSHPPARLARVSAGVWNYEVLEIKNGPYLDYEDQFQGVSLTVTDIVDRVTLTSSNTAEFTNAFTGGFVEYNSTNNRAIGIVRTKHSNASVSIEPLQERCFYLAKEVYALGLYTGFGAGGEAPYNAATAANYTAMPTGIFPTTTRLVKGGYYRIDTPGSTDWTVYGSLSNSSGQEFTSNQDVAAVAGTGSVANMNIGFSHQFAITTDIVGNYLRFVDAVGAPRWVFVNARRDVPEQSNYGVIAAGPVLSINGTNITVPVNYTGTVTQSDRVITANLRSSSAVFAATDVGRWFRLEYGPVVVHAKVTAFTNTTTVVVTLSRGVPLTGEGQNKRLDSVTTVWRRGAFYQGDYPRCVSFFEQRLCFAATATQPQTVWMSKTADYYNFDPTTDMSTVEDDSSINVTLATDIFQDIRWMTNRSVLVIGTSNAEWVITAGSTREAITPKTITARRESSYGAAAIQAVQCGRSAVFVQTGGLRIRELTYDYSVDAHVPLDVSVFASHLFQEHGQAVELHYIRQPEPMLVVVTSEGQVAVMAYEPDQKVYSWSRYILGGPHSPKIISACVTQDAGADTLWFMVERNNRWTLERMRPSYRPASREDVSTIHHFLDSAASITVITDPPTTEYVLTGHERFHNTTVSVLIDDQLYTNLTTSGSGLNITLPVAPTTRLIAGFTSVAKVLSFPILPSTRSGPLVGKTILPTRVRFRLRNTLDFLYGIDGVDLQEHKVRTFADPVTRTPYLRSEDLTLSLPRRFGTDTKWTIESRSPYPITIQSVTIEAIATD